MEKRAIIAAVLMAGLLIVYQVLFFPSSQEPPAPQAPKTPAEVPRQAPQQAAPAPAPVPAEASGPRKDRARPAQRTVAVEAPLYTAVVSSEGGKLQEWTLKYRGLKPMVAVGEFGPLGLLIGADQRPPE